MYYLYILYSEKVDKYYIGQTENIDQRLISHNSGISKYTSIANDWKLAYSEAFENRTAAINRENEIKKKKSRKYLEYLISSNKG